MSSALGHRVHLGGVPTVVASLVASTVVGAATVNVLLSQTPTRSGYRTAAVVAVVVAFTCFAGAVALARSTGRLRTALWGYVPGLAAVLVAGLLLSESALRAQHGSASPVLGLLLLALPSTWVPIWAAFRAHVATRREDHAARPWRGRL